MARKLRIAASVFFAVVTAALVVLWVRSYGVRKICQGPIGKHVLSFQSAQGELGIGFWDWQFKSFPWNIRTNADTEPLWPNANGESPLSNLGIRSYRQSVPDMTLVVVPFWLPVLMVATIGAAPWINHLRRFSLRTMFIAMTLVAVVLGLGVWLAS